MLWFRRTGPLTQAIFSLPLIGYISGQQAVMTVAVGLPVLFGILHATGGNVAAAVVPFIAISLFAMIRPPVMSYEARIFTLIKFYAVGGAVKSRKKRKMSGKARRRARFLGRPGRVKAGKKAAAAARPEPEPEPDADGAGGAGGDGTESMEVGTYPGSPVDVSITLRDRARNILPRRRVAIMLDGRQMRTAVSSGSGHIPVMIDPDDAVGTRTLAVCEIAPDGKAGAAIVEKHLVFVPMTRGGGR